MMGAECLFIGGSHDGQRYKIDTHLQSVRMAKRGTEYDPAPVFTETYVQRKMGWVLLERPFYVLESVEPREALELLIDGYRRAPTP